MSVQTYNNEGQRTAITYPRGWSDASGTWQQDPAVTYESGFDSEARLTGLTRKQTGYPDAVIAAGATYNLNGQMLTATIQGAARTWQYNDRGQLTRETAGTLMDFQYTFSATQNDGRVSQRKDWISGEGVQFQYDVLGRLSSSTATGAGVAWSQSFTHDGFGNLTQRSGSGTPLSVTVNAKNQVAGVGYDANGNQTSIGSHGLGYDAENRLAVVTNVSFSPYSGGGTEFYDYSMRGERLLVKRHQSSGSPVVPDWTQYELRFYDTNSQLLAVFDVVCAAPCTTANDPYYPVEKTDKKRVYFAARLVQVGAQAAVTDRLGSLIATRDTGTNQITRYRYYPYGEAIGTQEWDKPQFATYTRDGATGLDDAMNRQYDRFWGRFTSPDPYQASGGPADPGSWNRYAYVQGDPVNYADPAGLQAVGAEFYLNGQMMCYYSYVEGRRQVYSCHLLFIALAGQGRTEGNWDTTARAAAGWENRFTKFNQENKERTSNAAGTLHQNCLEAIKNAVGPDWLSRIKNANLMFWDSHERVQSHFTIGDVAGKTARNAEYYLTTAGTEGGGPQPWATVIQLHQGTGFVPSNNIVLHRGWFDLGATEQNLVLVHEALHAVFKVSDQGLAIDLGAARDGIAPGEAIHTFLKNNCPPSRP